MNFKRAKSIIEITQEELKALELAKDFLDALSNEEDVIDSFDVYRGSYCSNLCELTDGLEDLIDFLDNDQPHGYIINIIDEGGKLK